MYSDLFGRLKVLTKAPKILLVLFFSLMWLICVFWDYTMPRKNMNLPYSILMYWTNIWQPTVRVQQDIFEKTLVEDSSSHLYASFGTFCVQIDQLFEAQWDFKLSEEFEIDVIFLWKQRFYRFHAFFRDSLCLE